MTSTHSFFLTFEYRIYEYMFGPCRLSSVKRHSRCTARRLAWAWRSARRAMRLDHPDPCGGGGGGGRLPRAPRTPPSSSRLLEKPRRHSRAGVRSRPSCVASPGHPTRSSNASRGRRSGHERRSRCGGGDRSAAPEASCGDDARSRKREHAAWSPSSPSVSRGATLVTPPPRPASDTRRRLAAPTHGSLPQPPAVGGGS